MASLFTVRNEVLAVRVEVIAVVSGQAVRRGRQRGAHLLDEDAPAQALHAANVVLAARPYGFERRCLVDGRRARVRAADRSFTPADARKGIVSQVVG